MAVMRDAGPGHNGMGHPSLSYLRELPMDILKIDTSLSSHFSGSGSS